MKTIARIIICSFFLVLVTSCLKDETILDVAQYELVARMETDVRTKTSLSSLQDGMYYPLWSAGDEIAVYVDGDENPAKFTLQSGAGTTEAFFCGSREGLGYYAVYPFSAAGSNQDETILLTLPQTQYYVEDSFGPNSYPMIASGTRDGLDFKNLCAVMRVSIKGQAIIRSITLTAKDSSIYLSGPASVALGSNNELEMKMLEGGSSSIVLECDDIKLSNNVIDFYIAVPAQTYYGGLEISIDAYTEIIKKNIDSDLIFKRSQMRQLKNLEVYTNMDEHQMRLLKERDALVKIYEDLDGDNWYYKYDNSDVRNENWCTDLPVGQWEGIKTNLEGYVTEIDLYGCNLTGSIPPEIGDFIELKKLCLANNNISGQIPAEISYLSKLEELLLFNNKLDGEIPDELMNLVHLKEFRISNNKLSGEIPSKIGNLKELEFIQLGGNRLTGKIPDEIVGLTSLTRIQLAQNSLTGEIPSEIGNLSNLEELLLEENLLEGSIPESVIKLKNIKEIRTFSNFLSGEIPESFYNWQYWKGWWGFCMFQNNFKFEDIKLRGPEGRITCFNGQTIELPEEYKRNKYTILFQWTSGRDPMLGEETSFILPQMKYIHEHYSDKGIRIIGWGNSYGDTKESALQYIEETGMEWENFYYEPKEALAHCYYNDNVNNTFGNIPYYPSIKVTTVTIVDSIGRIAFSDVFDRKIYEKEGYLKELIENDLKPNKDDYYKSTDYSRDGIINILQRATEGNGVNIVLMGDGYSDRQIEDGTYLKDMNFAYTNLFNKEPFKTYKNMFNVSCVNVVSATEGLEYGNTALDCGFGNGTHVFGNDKKTFNYALKVVGADIMDETLIVVLLNSNKYAGTCYMYSPIESGKDYGQGLSVAYFPKGSGPNTFSELLHHEANGHGFSKLSDEYAYESYGTIPSDEVEKMKNQQSLYGWWKNIDFTNDPAQVRWKKFLEDSRYANEGLGIFEGGSTYWSGVWRPTENSIMRHNRGEFNAPSREAIYYRIHKLAYGDDWKCDYEKFVEYDAVNRKSTAASTKSYVLPLKPQPALHPPVVVGKNWREAE